MTADVVPLRSKPKIVEVVGGDSLDHTRMLNPRTLAIERCADEIERRLGSRLTIDQRIGLERALDRLVDEVQWHKRDPWC
jgi:hypothetical protein